MLHPAGFAGAPVVLGTDDGELTETLPRLIEPQWEYDGVLQGLFRPFTSLRVDLPGGIAVGHTFTGELFEMEDQRNWGDGSFKTYSTPQALGIPHRAEAGTRFLQRVVVRVAGAERAPAAPDPAAPVGLHVGTGTGRRLPAIGLGAGTATAPARPSPRRRRTTCASRSARGRTVSRRRPPWPRSSAAGWRSACTSTPTAAGRTSSPSPSPSSGRSSSRATGSPPARRWTPPPGGCASRPSGTAAPRSPTSTAPVPTPGRWRAWPSRCPCSTT